MPVPKRKRSRQRRDKRFANKGISFKSITLCSQCSKPLTGHTACMECGYYKGRKVLTTKADRRLAKAQKSSSAQSAQTAGVDE